MDQTRDAQQPPSQPPPGYYQEPIGPPASSPVTAFTQVAQAGGHRRSRDRRSRRRGGHRGCGRQQCGPERGEPQAGHGGQEPCRSTDPGEHASGSGDLASVPVSRCQNGSRPGNRHRRRQCLGSLPGPECHAEPAGSCAELAGQGDPGGDGPASGVPDQRRRRVRGWEGHQAGRLPHKWQRQRWR